MIKLAIRRSVTTLMLTLLVILLGVVSLSRIPLDLFPKFEFLYSAVYVKYEDASSYEVESYVVEPLEKVLSTTKNVKNITSTASSETAIIVMEFQSGTNMNFASLDIREKIDMVKDFLPQEATSPLVFEFDPSMMPVLNVIVASDKMNQDELKTLLDEKLETNLKRLNGVASVNIEGGYQTEIQLVVNSIKYQNLLSQGKLTVQDEQGIERPIGMEQIYKTISQTLSMSKYDIPIGIIDEGSQQFSFKFEGTLETAADINDIRLHINEDVVKVNDLFDVITGYTNKDLINMLNNKDAVTVSIQKESNANTVSVSRLVKKEIDTFANQNNDIEYEYMLDTAGYIEKSINTVTINAIIGGILAVVILYLFLKNVRSTIIIGASIPISIIAIFVLMYFNEMTLNIVSLGGLAIGVGMLVDNSIVVLENIDRYLKLGCDRKEAAYKGAKEVSLPIIASTLTTMNSPLSSRQCKKIK